MKPERRGGMRAGYRVFHPEIPPCLLLMLRSEKASLKAKPLTFGGQALFLLVTPTGSKLWRLKYRFAGKEKLLALGAYPETTLKKARDKLDEARAILREGRIRPPNERRQNRGRKPPSSRWRSHFSMRSPRSGTGLKYIGRAQSANSKSTSFHGWRIAPSIKLRRPTFLPCLKN